MDRPTMAETPVSLLRRVKVRQDKEAWDRFIRHYTPLLYHWARYLGISREDAADRVQDTFLLLLAKIPNFEYDDHKKFRAWLWTLFRNRCREAKRHADVLGSAVHGMLHATSTGDPLDEQIEREHRSQKTHQCLHLIATEFCEKTSEIFWQYVALERSPAEIARNLDISVDQVYQAKSRVVRRFRVLFASKIA